MTPENLDFATRLLRNSGFNILGADGQFIYMEDPACIARSFQTFAEYALIIAICLTGVFLFGWAFSIIRGGKSDIKTIANNFRNLVMIFGILGVTGYIVNAIYGDNIFVCKSIQISQNDVQNLLNLRNKSLTKRGEQELYESLDIQDSGVIYNNSEQITDNTERTDSSFAETTEINSITQSNEISNSPKNDNTYDKTHTNDYTANHISKSTENMPTSAVQGDSSKEVVYRHPNGQKTVKSGGTRAWRNNNPGNIRYANQRGAIGSAGGFAVFPDEQTGMDALYALLKTPKYANSSIRDAMKRYAPTQDGNNPKSYAAKIAARAGVPVDTKLNQLTAAQLDIVASTIRDIEGWVPGNIKKQ